MKKIIAILLAGLLSCNVTTLSKEISNVSAIVTPSEHNISTQKTICKNYKVYDLKITNNNPKALLVSSDTEVSFINEFDEVIKSKSRRTQYKKSRKKDLGRYYAIALPGAIIGGVITGITLFIASPIGGAIAVGTYLPTDKAVRTNVAISQDLFNTNGLPLRLEPKKTYNIRILAPKDLELKEVIFSNISFDLENMHELKATVEDL